MAEKSFYVIKDGLVHNCRTEERYKSFIEDGWKKYNPKAQKDNDPPKDQEDPHKKQE